MLEYQVEVIIFSKTFLQKILSPIQCYLFAELHLILANHFFLTFRKVNVRK